MRSQIRTIASRRKCCALRARARVRVCAREAGRPKRKRGTRPSCQRSVRRRPFYHPSCGRVNAPAPPFPTFFRNFGTEPPRASKNVGEARAVPKRQAALRGESHRTRPRCATFARRAWGAPVARPREVAPLSRPGGLPANPSGSSPGPIKALGAGRSGTTKQSLFFVRNIFNGTFKGNARRIHEHCER